MNKYIQGYLKIGVEVRQYVAWMYFDGKLCLINKMKTQPAPLPWAKFGRN